MADVLNHYSDVQQYLNKILTQNNQLQDTEGAIHGAFWNNMTCEQFKTGNVPHVSDPDTGGPMPILVVGDPDNSNIIKALRGTPGSPFDPNTGAFGQMPADGPPFFTPEQIAPLADWIKNGCNC